MRIILILLFFCFALPNCSSDNANNKPLPRQKMQGVIFDLLRADELANNFILRDTSLKRDSVATQLYEQVFAIHKIDRKRFYNSYKYYQAHPDLNKELYDSLISWGNRKRNATTVQ